MSVFEGMLALGQQAPPPGAGCQQMGLFMILIFAVFYFIVIRPQRKEQEKQQHFLERLKEGDKVIMTSGILGRIVAIDKAIVTIDVGDRTRVRFLRNQVARHQDGFGEDAAEDDKKTDSEKADGDTAAGGKKKKK